MKRAWVCLLVAFALALPLMGQQERTGGGRYDQQIQQAVHKELQKHDTFKTIRASVDDGIVTLQGQVPLFVDKVKAEKEVRRIEHVAGVRNQVEVSSTVADTVLRQKLADKLRYDRIGFGILYNNLTLKVHDGVVTVGGQVLDYPSEMSAIGIVQTEPGVKDVIDDIQVLPASPFDDALRIKLARAIYGQASMQKYAIDPQAPIRIVVHNGHVTLNGVVDTAMDKQIAGIQANSVPGVFSVKNNLIVESQPKGK